MNNENISEVVLSTAYLAPVQYYSKLAGYDKIFIERFENYSKQSYRNRCTIFAANGPLSLVIPVKKNNKLKTLISDIKIDYTSNWQKIHLKSIESAYNSSPFYQYYIDELLPYFSRQYSFLIDFNTDLQKVIMKLLNIDKQILFTEEYLKSPSQNTHDFRQTIHPKKIIADSLFSPVDYYQVFAVKFGFLPNLSIIDLLFNVGNNASEILVN
jgi:hypothetical protein